MTKPLIKESLRKVGRIVKISGLVMAGLFVCLALTYPIVYARDQFTQWRTLGRLVGRHAGINEAVPYLPADATVHIDGVDTEGSPTIGAYVRSARRPQNGTVVAYREVQYPFHQRHRRCLLKFENDVLVWLRDEDELED